MKIKIFVLAVFLICSFTLMTDAFAADYVAQIGDDKYETLSGAINAAGSTQTTIALINNITLTGKLSFPKGSNITLDLNNKSLTVPTVENNYGIVVAGNLTIKGKGIVTLGMYGIGVGTTGNLTIEDGTYKCQSGDYLLGSWNKAVIKGGVFDGNYCIANGFNGGTVEILDGTFYSKESTIVLGGIKIFGGSFNHNVDDYLADGVEMKLYDGLYFTGKLYSITVANGKNGTIEVVSEAVEEQPVKVSANASKGYVLDNIKVTDSEDKIIAVANGEFVMPSSNVTVTGIFEVDALDDTPQTGGIDVPFFIVFTVSAIAMLGVVILRKVKMTKPNN